MKYAKLRGKIYEKYRRQGDFADEIGMDRATLSGKMNGRTQWTLDEVCRACEVLDIPLCDAHEYFFYCESCENATA